MEITLRLNLNDRQSWRNWLTQNHNTQKECWLSVTRGKTSKTFHLSINASALATYNTTAAAN